MDAQPGDVGLDALRVADGRPEPRGEQLAIVDPPDRPGDDVEIEGTLAFEGVDPPLDGEVLVSGQSDDATAG